MKKLFRHLRDSPVFFIQLINQNGTTRVDSPERDWHRFTTELADLGNCKRVSLHACVLLEGQAKLLVEFVQKDLKSHDSDEIQKQLIFEIEKCFPSRSVSYLDRIVDGVTYQETYKEIYRSPVEGRLSSQVEDYSHSSLRSLLGLAPRTFPVCDHMNLIFNPSAQLRWLNTPTSCLRVTARKRFHQEIPSKASAFLKASDSRLRSGTAP